MSDVGEDFFNKYFLFAFNKQTNHSNFQSNAESEFFSGTFVLIDFLLTDDRHPVIDERYVNISPKNSIESEMYLIFSLKLILCISNLYIISLPDVFPINQYQMRFI